MTPVAIIVAYMVLVFVGQRVMRDRKPFGLINSLALWNFALSAFSLMGACRTVPHLILNLMTRPMSATICTTAAADWGGSGSSSSFTPRSRSLWTRSSSCCARSR